MMFIIDLQDFRFITLLILFRQKRDKDNIQLSIFTKKK